jgi:UDP-3-O-[3-hydroxymyristoyl] N-acetylglucosamine deacetylase
VSIGYHQKTIGNEIRFEGVGLHTGTQIEVLLRPAKAHTGIIFKRLDTNGQEVEAKPHNVVSSPLATSLGSGQQAIMTIEHFLAALYALGIDNLYVDIKGPEMPILDGSSKGFLEILKKETTLSSLNEAKKALVVESPFTVSDPKDEAKFITVSPCKTKTPTLTYVIDFKDNPFIGRQELTMPMTPLSFLKYASFARTFCTQEEIDYLWSQGLAKGGSLENALVISKEKGVLNEGGFQDPLECVRHKILDFLGDLHLLGFVLVGDVYIHKAGHALHNKLATTLLEAPHTTKKMRVMNEDFEYEIPFPESLEGL